MTNGLIPRMLAAEYDIVVPTWAVPVILGIAAVAALVAIIVVRRKS